MSSPGRHAVAGAAWLTISYSAAKVLSFGANWALGFLLSDRDFGVYAIALSASSLIVILRDAGIPRCLVQRGDEYDRIARPFFTIALLTNLAIGIALILAAPAVARYYDSAELVTLLRVIGLAVPFGTISMVVLAKLSIDLRFRDLARITSFSAALRYILTVAAALLGLGPLSFILPLPIVSLYEALHGWFLVGWPARGSRLTADLWRVLWKDVKWLLLANVAIALILQGDYLIVGKLEPKAITGQYFFAFQLIASTMIPFTESLASVLVPSFVALKAERDQQDRAYLKVLTNVGVIGVPIAIGTFLVARPLIHVLWGGRWDAVSLAAELLALSLVYRLHYQASMSFIQARGDWRLWTVLLSLEGIGNVAAAGLGAFLGGLDTIALVIGVYRVASSLAIVMVGCRVARLGVAAGLAASGLPLILGVAAGGAVYGVFEMLVPRQPPLVDLLLSGSCFVGLYAGLLRLIAPAHAEFLWDLLPATWRRRFRGAA